ncbi:hypothetical protein PN478_09540 [Dolichospermum circinale CS-534/05]|uniref:hypothetical protein n=1 Tax=Dolichospermum circinale TaxID=109265 RepID=UPI00232E1F22|nr:hypothetical protein [Dolichospermum circinale]MDB9490764.1 hypothetical protein [Dolichospermum circinale CS-534/05]
MIKYTEYHEYQGVTYPVVKYEPESEDEVLEYEERELAVRNNLAMANNSCQSAKLHLSCLGNLNDKFSESERLNMAYESILVAIKMIQSSQGLLDV